MSSPNEHCPNLKVHGTEMLTVSSDVYLGDEISSDGSNKLNIQRRVSKGVGIIYQLMNLLETTSVGKHYFKIALLLRDSIFLNSIFINSEVWYGVTKSEIEQLESVDRTLLRRIFRLPISTPISGLYLESGCMRIGTSINFLHYLLNQPKEGMLSKFFYAQWQHSSRLDWTEQVKVDLFDFGLPRELELLESKSTKKFKNLIKKEAREFLLRSLVTIKNTQSKMKNLEYDKLKLQKYLQTMDRDLAIHVLRFRLRMAPM